MAIQPKKQSCNRTRAAIIEIEQSLNLHLDWKGKANTASRYDPARAQERNELSRASQKSSAGSIPVLNADMVRKLIGLVLQATHKSVGYERDSHVLLSSPKIRPDYEKLNSYNFPDLAVLSLNEVLMMWFIEPLNDEAITVPIKNRLHQIFLSPPEMRRKQMYYMEITEKKEIPIKYLPLVEKGGEWAEPIKRVIMNRSDLIQHSVVIGLKWMLLKSLINKKRLPFEGYAYIRIKGTI